MEILVLHHKELTNLMELEAQRKDEERQEEEVTEEIHDTGNGKGIFFSWGGTVSFWVTGPEFRMVWRLQGLFRMQSSATVLCMMRKKELLLMHHWITFFKIVDRIESQGTCAINISLKWSCTLPVVSCCWWLSLSSTISHLLSLLHSIILLVCSLRASLCMPAALNYCSF